MRSSVRALSPLGVALLTVIVASLVGCSGGILTPDRDRSPDEGTPFYYYEHQPIYLKVDPTGMVLLPVDDIASDSSAVHDAVEGRLSAHGLELDTLRPLGGPPFNWLVKLKGSVGADGAAAARMDLLMSPELRAVIPTYRTAASDAPLYVLNRAVAKFKGGVSRSQITSLVESLGAEVVSIQNWGAGGTWYLIEPATGSHAHILGIANRIDEGSIALWAAPDMVDPNLRPTSLLPRGDSGIGSSR